MHVLGRCVTKCNWQLCLFTPFRAHAVNSRQVELWHGSIHKNYVEYASCYVKNDAFSKRNSEHYNTCRHVEYLECLYLMYRAA